jgi:SAM-dependent methyltransferase
MELREPGTGAPLVPDGPGALRGERRRWPVVAGIPFLRTGREELADAALAAGREEEALVVLLADQDDWWPYGLPSEDDRRRALTAPTLRAAMDALGFGPVGTYFANRWSDPTFLSGLALLDRHAGGARSLFELACGAGHLLREAAARGVRVAGADVVFSKLWLARRFVVPEAALVCCDAASGIPLDERFDVALCHDALHYLPDVPGAVAELRRVGARVLVGHAHNAAVESLSAGAPLDLGGYAALLPGARTYDDAALGRALAWGGVPGEATPRSTAFAFALAPEAPADPPYALPAPGACVQPNPLLDERGVRWPSPRWQEEYAPLSEHLTAPAELGDPRRRRLVVDLPEAW